MALNGKKKTIWGLFWAILHVLLAQKRDWKTPSCTQTELSDLLSSWSLQKMQFIQQSDMAGWEKSITWVFLAGSLQPDYVLRLNTNSGLVRVLAVSLFACSSDRWHGWFFWEGTCQQPKIALYVKEVGEKKSVETVNKTALKAVLRSTIMTSAWECNVARKTHYGGWFCTLFARYLEARPH